MRDLLRTIATFGQPLYMIFEEEDGQIYLVDRPVPGLDKTFFEDLLAAGLYSKCKSGVCFPTVKGVEEIEKRGGPRPPSIL